MQELGVPYWRRAIVEKRLGKTQNRIKRFADRIAAGRSFRRGFNPLSACLGSIQRVPLRLMFDKFRDDIGIDSGRCVRCGLCAELCPTGNIVLTGKDVKTKGTCTLCLRCYNFCPESAVTYRNRVHNAKRGKPYQGPVAGFDPRIMR